MGGTPGTLAGPVFLGAAAADVYVPLANTFALIRHIHVANVTGAPVTCSFFLGATGGSAAGTQLKGGGSVPANSEIDIYFAGSGLRVSVTQFLTGIASSGSALVVTVIGDKYAT